MTDPREPLVRTLGEVLHRARVAGGEQRPDSPPDHPMTLEVTAP